MTKMGTLGGFWSQAYAINNKGQVTGLAYTKNGSAHAFIANCAPCPLKDLGTFAGSTSTVWGFGINDSGVVVGQSSFQGTYHAFVYSGGKIKDLNVMIPAGSAWVLIDAESINATGQIVGMGTHNGQEHAYLLTRATPARARATCPPVCSRAASHGASWRSPRWSSCSRRGGVICLSSPPPPPRSAGA